MNKSKIETYKSEKGLFFAQAGFGYSGRNVLQVNNYLFNESIVEVQNTHHRSWFLLEGQESITSIKKKAPTQYINHRWELIDKEDNELCLPETLTTQEAFEWYDEDDYCHYIGKECDQYKYRSLYKRTYDIAPQEWVDCTDDFEIVNLGTIKVEDVESFQDAKVYVLGERDYKKVPLETKLINVTKFNEIEEMLTPDLLIHNRPCKVDADTTYKIIRNHVRENIDGRYARITSDYDFCFTVKKVVSIKPYEYKTEEKKSNGKSYKRPRFRTTKVENKLVEIFEMCPSKPYQKYTPIQGFEGDNLKDLAENIKLYLDELMAVINEPLKECEFCQGTGHIINKVENINER